MEETKKEEKKERTPKGFEDEIARKNDLMVKAMGKIELLQGRLEQKEKELAQSKERCKALEEATAMIKPGMTPSIAS